MIGQSLGRYTIESKLGEGGMGVVFKARDTQLERVVAIKILHADSVSDPDRKRRFAIEAKAASALNHPNIVTIFDIARHQDTDFIVMEYVAGTTLARIIPRKGLPVSQALTFATALADALATAHEAGIVHRDLKPANVMISDAGAVKILDFGVAKLLGTPDRTAPTQTAVATQEGARIGTPAYMSPEQAEGRSLDARADIFSFGSVLYEMVTGRRAFGGDSRLAIMAKILNEEPVAPTHFVTALPLELEKTILRCLRKDPARRYQTMADLKVALEDLASESGNGPARRIPAPSLSLARRWPLPVAMALLAVALYYVLQSWRRSPEAEALRALPITSLSGAVRTPSLSPDGNHVVFTWTGARQDNADLYVQQIGVGSAIRLTTDSGNDYSPSWSPDGRTIAFLRRAPGALASEVLLIPPLGGPERKVADIQPTAALYRATSLSWCPDASCVVVTDAPRGGARDAVFAIALETGEKRQLTFPPESAFLDMDPAMSPDGRWLVFRRDLTPFTGDLYRLGLKEHLLPDGEPVQVTFSESSSAAPGRPSWTPDSQEVVFSAKSALWRLNPHRSRPPARLPFVGQDGATPVVARSREGQQRLVYVRSFADTNVWRLDLSAAGTPASSPPVVAIASTRRDDIPNLSPSGRRMAFLSNRSGESEVWVADVDGSDAIQLTSLASFPGFPRWSPDGKWIAFHSDPKKRPDILVVPAGGGRPRVVTGDGDGGAFPTFSRDGQWIYFSGPGQKIWKIALSGGAPVQIIANDGTVAIESPDGRDLYYAEAADRPSTLWRQSLAGGAPVKVVEGVIFANFDVVDGGVYYMDRVSGETGGFFADRPAGESRLRYYDFATRQSITVARNLGSVSAGLSASRDGRLVMFARVDSSVDELTLVDNFR